MIGLLIPVLLFTACGKQQAASPGTAPTPSPAPPAANLLDTVKKNGKIRYGTEGTYSPFSFHDKDGKLTGFDVEIAQEVAKRLGVQPEFIETKWEGMLAGLDAKRFDAVVNEVSINDDRKAYIVSKAY